MTDDNTQAVTPATTQDSPPAAPVPPVAPVQDVTAAQAPAPVTPAPTLSDLRADIEAAQTNFQAALAAMDTARTAYDRAAMLGVK